MRAEAPGGEAADDRPPGGDRIQHRPPRTAPAPCRTKPAAGMSPQVFEYNLAGTAKNEPNMIVRFTLQGDGKRIDKAIAAIEEGTKRSTGVRVSQSPAAIEPALETFPSSIGPQAPGDRYPLYASLHAAPGRRRDFAT